MISLKRLALGTCLVVFAGGLALLLSHALEPLGLDTVLAAEEPVADPAQKPRDPWTLANFPGLIAFACGAWVALRVLWEGLRTIVDAFWSDSPAEY